MLTRNLGRSGLRVSLVGLGCNNFGGRIDDEAARKVVDAAIEHGITLFDTADVYGARGGSETALGQLLGPRRKDIVLASKFGMDMNDAGTMKGGSRRYIMSAVEASLKRLKTDWLDLYQFHRADPLTPIDETLRALEDLIRQGKVRYIGCSNMPAWQMANAEWTARDLGINGFASCQDEYSLLVRGAEKDLIPAARHFGMGLLPYFPLANGLLTGKYKRNAPMPEGARMTKESKRADEVLTEVNWEKTEKLTAFCEARGKTLVELAFSWLAAQPVVSSVIAGATKPEQIAANVKAAEWALTADELAEIDTITK
ncbi:aryl-alcohol dehydrogenase-like predicted oxidoreductase [Bosea sp. BE125]|uniref:aldo/keto reductase n=1 Tax=Bosea sp. BE125 TaxID=2817909 RepID=UPI00285EF0D7|nr:aldo/keto reductase [Bosea sp. BE125]MDR6872518.1 aryl-alcohol dehydrogenase-like predicted oxidoreductase [Bosea sp. BE125]